MIFPSKIVEAKATNNDNASNMLGKYTGVRARIKDKCDFVTFVPCAGHSLNLLGVHDAGCVLEATKFFDIIQKLNFFLVSMYR